MNEAMISTNSALKTESDSQDASMSAWVTRASSAWYYVVISIDTNTILVTVQNASMLKNKTAQIVKSSDVWYYVMISIDTNTVLIMISTETRSKHISSQSHWDLCVKQNKKQ